MVNHYTQTFNTASVAVTSMSSAVNQVDSGVELAQQAGDAINQIKEESNRVIATVSSISSALVEQSKASDDIAAHVEKVAQMTEENHAATEATADAANKERPPSPRDLCDLLFKIFRQVACMTLQRIS